MSAASLLAAAPAEAAAHGAGPAESTSLLFVFMLATFIGLGVVTRVSRLLHTPLMSLTNAISAIAVVGAIVDRRARTTRRSSRCSARSRSFASMTNIVSGFLITDRMLQDVQEARRRARSGIELLADRGRLPGRAALFIFSLHWMNDPKTARRGVLAGCRRDDAGDPRRRSCTPGIVNWGWIAGAVRAGIRCRRAAVVGAAHRGAAADRPVARLRRPGRGAGRARPSSTSG